MGSCAHHYYLLMIMADHEVAIARMEPIENSDTKAIKLKMLAIKLKKDLASTREEVCDLSLSSYRHPYRFLFLFSLAKPNSPKERQKSNIL